MRNELKMNRLFLSFALFCAANFSFSYSLILSIFHSPVDYDISLAGNFGEPRPHHFHGGLDIKTEGREGKHIYAIGDGYVSRVTSGLYGFGNAVYITHPSGHTSVYCHLKSFSPRIRAALLRYQYQHQTSVSDARLSPLDCPVSQGQFIALSGNTGSSTAPHLHLEIHDTRTWDMLDPYPFLSDFINDTVPPRAHGFMACPQDKFSRFNGSSKFAVFYLQSTNTAWGRVGFALWADDYMQDSYNHYGVRETHLLVDGKEVFSSCVDRIPVSHNRLVNSWGDYDHWLHRRAWYLRSYKEPGNNLSILHTDQRRGIVDFSEERDYHLEYILRDYKNNEARYAFTVHAQRPADSNNSVSKDRDMTAAGLSVPFRWNQTNTYSLPGMQLIVPYGLLTRDVTIHPSIQEATEIDALSDAFTFHDASLPLVSDASVSISVQAPVEDPSKLYVTSGGKYMGGEYDDGWVKGHLRELGATYQLAYDAEPPRISELSLNAPRLALSCSDKESGLDSWTATIDGRFVVFESVEKSSTFSCDLRETWLPRSGKTHQLLFTATDNRHNSRTYQASFVY